MVIMFCMEVACKDFLQFGGLFVEVMEYMQKVLLQRPHKPCTIRGPRWRETRKGPAISNTILLLPSYSTDVYRLVSRDTF